MDNTRPTDASPTDTLSRLRAGQLAGVTELDLRGCGLEDLPPEVFSLADTLTTMDLSGNHLRQLPEGFDRLRHLRTLFCSDNQFTRLPAVLGRCTALDIVGFKANQIAHVPAQALAASLRWLILTDNRIAELPETLGACTRLQKLMLAGNQLTRLPASIGACQQLELVRLAANQFETAAAALPAGLLALPRLAWLAHAGNPFSQATEARAEAQAPCLDIAWADLQVQALLGTGASGVIHAANWARQGQPPQAVAVKLFKAGMTSDGLPHCEWVANLAAGSHPNIVGVLGRLVGHPEGTQGLVMQRIPASLRNLAAPPSLASCTRDVYPAGLRLPAAHALATARNTRSALLHLHAQGLTHGDLYAHNTGVDDHGHSLLGDLGAASFLPTDDPPRCQALQQIDRRALGVLIDELAHHCDDPAALSSLCSTA